MMSSRIRGAISLLLWWAGLTVLLWTGGRIRQEPATLVACAASAALLVSLGEVAHWLRLRLRRAWAARQDTRR